LRSADPAERLAAVKLLGERTSLAAQDILRTLLKEAEAAGDSPMMAATAKSISQIEAHISRINAVGTAFRGLSLGSVLLVVAIGLAITFGLMGIINMAHGEFIAIGAYTTYLIQNLFAGGVSLQIPLFVTDPVAVRIPGMNLTGGALDSYFLFAIPLSFQI